MKKIFFLLVSSLLSATSTEIVAQPNTNEPEATLVIEESVKHLKVGKQMKIKKRNALIKEYKQIIEQEGGQETDDLYLPNGMSTAVYIQDNGNLYKVLSNKNITNYCKAYDIWRKAFCARADRPLDLYTDGIAIINATIIADTARARYDRLKQLNEELMDIYELAVANISDLNKLLNKEQGDTFTVAKLRSEQLKSLRANWQMDTVFHSPIAANGNRVYKRLERNWYSYIYDNGLKVDSINWNDVMFKDDDMNTKIYKIAREIVASDDPDVDMIDINKFAQAIFYKFSKDYESFGFNEAKRIYEADKELVHSKAQSILASINPDEMIKKEYFTQIYNRGIDRRFAEMDGWIIDGRDIEKLVVNYRERWEKEGDELVDEILANNTLRTNRDNTAAMQLYYIALLNKYAAEPTYDLTLDIVNRAQRLELYGDAISYSQAMFSYPEFLDESKFQQARMYLRVVQCYEKLKGSTAQRYPYLQKAMQACPEYPEPYYYLANMIQGVNLGKQRAIVKRFIFCIAYDQFEIARQKLLALQAMGDDTDIKSNLTVDVLQKAQARCKGYFPYREDVFLEGPAIGMTDGKPYTLHLPFGKFTSIVRTQMRTE